MTTFYVGASVASVPRAQTLSLSRVTASKVVRGPHQETTVRIASDGYIDCRDGRHVRTPGFHEEKVDPMPEGEALAFLLSHSFPSHRRIVRPMSVDERSRIRLAAWADSVSERMTLVDRIWRAITEPVLPPANSHEPELVQVVQLGGWAYALYLDGPVTRVLPPGGVPVGELPSRTKKILELDRKTA